jgi:hypothetical protein
MNRHCMKSLFPAVIVFITVLCACTNEKGKPHGFVNHDKWVIDNFTTTRNTLKHQPKEVYDSYYEDLSDTTLDATGKLNTTYNYRLDKEGNIVFVQISSNSTGYHEMRYRYNDSGRHHESRSFNMNGKLIEVEQGVSQKKAKGVYEVTELEDGKPTGKIRKYTFSDGGSRVMDQKFDNGVSKFTSDFTYEGDRLLSEVRNVDWISRHNYYYSEKGFLDSIVVQGNNEKRVHSFINNEYGDAVYKQETKNGELLYATWLHYRYDEKGNWIRRIVRQTGQGIAAYQHGKNPEYLLAVREIKY